MADMTLEAYLNQFQKETEELLVRISWVPGAVHPESGRIGDRYRVQARFDAAIDPETDQIVYSGIACNIEWLVKKRLFSDPFGYRFKVGCCYRLLLRRTRQETKTPSWYVEQVLEKEVSEPRLDPIQNFLKDYADEEQELLVLNRKKPYGWGSFWGYPRIFLSALAWIDCASDTLHPNVSTFAMLSKNRTSAVPMKFEALSAYRVTARRHLHREKNWLITGVHGPARDPRLDQIISDYQKPVTLTDPLGSFCLNRDYDWYEGRIAWLDGEAEVLLNVEPGETDASAAFNTLHRIVEDIPSFDRTCRTAVSEQMYDLLLDWYDEPITKEAFRDRIGMPFLSIDTDGSGMVSYESGELFADHVIQLEFDADLQPGETDLAG